MDRGHHDRGPPRGGQGPPGRQYHAQPPEPEEGEFFPPPPDAYAPPGQHSSYQPQHRHPAVPAEYGRGSSGGAYAPSRGQGPGPRGPPYPPADYPAAAAGGYQDSRQGRAAERTGPLQQRERSRDRAARVSGGQEQGYRQPSRYPAEALGRSSSRYPDLAPSRSQHDDAGRSRGHQGAGDRSYGQQQHYRDDRGSSRAPAYQQGYSPAAAAAGGGGAAYPGQQQQQQPGYNRQGSYGQGSGGGSGAQGSGFGRHDGYGSGGGRSHPPAGGSGGGRSGSSYPPPGGSGGRQGPGYGGDQGSYRGSSGGPVWGAGPGPGYGPRPGSGGPGGFGSQGAGYCSGGREAGRVHPGEHAGGVSAQHSAPYDSRDRPRGPAAMLQNLETGQSAMLGVLAGKKHFWLEASPAPGSSSQLIERRRGHGSVEQRSFTVMANLFLLNVARQNLYHYDVSFQRKRSAHGRDPGPSAGGAAAEGLNLKPPENAREIIDAFVQQYFVDERGRPLKEAWAFDGGKNLITAHRLKLKGGIQLPTDKHGKLEVTVWGVPVAGKGKNADWQLTFQLTRELRQVDEVNQFPAKISQLLAENRDTSEVQQTFSDTRQALEWVLKQAFIAAHEVMEVRRTLYFAVNKGNRNIGGGLRAMIGLSTGIKQGESQVLFAADMTASAFLRTDYNLVEWMADVAGFHKQAPSEGGGRGGGRFGDGSGGRGGGRGRGRSLPEVGEPDVDRLMRALEDENTQRRLFRQFNSKLHNKKVVFKDLQGNVMCKFTVVRLMAEPADRAMFYCQYKQAAADGTEGAEISVAYYFEHLANPRKRLDYPRLPAIEMKVPKPKEGQEPRKLWIPPERLWFDRGQRIQAVTHKGGTEQMIEAARKQPGELAAAIQQPITNATTGSSSSNGGGGGKEVLSRMKVELDSSMQQIKARVLPGPWLSYRQGRPGREETKTFNTGTAGTWNMNNFKFSNPASLLRWGVVAFVPRHGFERPPVQYNSLGTWLLDFIRRCHDLGLDMGYNPQAAPVVASELLRDLLVQDMEWVEAGEDAPYSRVEEALRRVRERAGGDQCQLILCFISHKPSVLYSRIKVASELENASGGLGLVTQVVVAGKTDLGSFTRGGPKPQQRSQYQANLAMKVNAKVGGVNTCWSVLGHELLRGYFTKEVPAIQVFGIDITHPGRVAGMRSKAAVVGSLDPAFCRYGQSYWEEEIGGSEVLSKEKIKAAFEDLIKKYYQANGVKPGCLLVYRDGVSDSELDRVRVDEVASIIEACASIRADGNYRPRIVYVVVQKRHQVRLFDASGGHGQLRNVEPGTVIDHTIVSPAVHDFYLNSHKDIQGAGTSRATRYICLLDELGFGPDGLQVFTYWMCYLYCRCTRAVSIVAPVYYAHLLAYRVRVLDEGDSMSLVSGSSGADSQAGRLEPKYCDILADKMFFV